MTSLLTYGSPASRKPAHGINLMEQTRPNFLRKNELSVRKGSGARAGGHPQGKTPCARLSFLAGEVAN